MELLQLESISRRFGGLTALSDVSFSVMEGEILGVIGPNGAGKSTLFNVLAGVFPASTGRVMFLGRDVTHCSTPEIVRLGMARTFQTTRLFKTLSVLDNVCIGAHSRTTAGLFDALLQTPHARREKEATRQSALVLLEQAGLHGIANHRASSLPYGDQRKLEIVRALATQPRLLLVDEPAAGMNRIESDELRDFLAGLRSQGQTIVLIEHDMKLVMHLCDRIVVLDHGTKIAEGPPQQIQRDPKVIEAYVGPEAFDAAA